MDNIEDFYFDILLKISSLLILFLLSKSLIINDVIHKFILIMSQSTNKIDGSERGGKKTTVKNHNYNSSETE